MDVRRLRVGELLSGVVGALLLVSLFLPWYEEGRRGWDSFAGLDVIFATAGLFALAVPVVTATQRTVAVPIAMATVTCILGLVATSLALWRTLDLPSATTGRAAGVFVGLGACAGIALASAIAMRDERRGPDTDATGRPVHGSPEIESLPTPSAQASGDTAR